MNSRDNPFKPGYGLPPPYLAGRDEPQKLLAGKLATMAAGGLVNGVVIYGPRGMGKTVLLGWLQEQCKAKGIRHVSGTSATMLGSVSTLAKALLSSSRWLRQWHLGLGVKGLGAARAVAEELMANDGIDHASVLSIVENGLDTASSNGADRETRAREIIRELSRMDFFWRPPGSRLMVPGIPSFMNYIQDRSSE